MGDETYASVCTSLFIIALIACVIYAIYSPIPEPQSKPPKPPINITNTGNKVGKNVGRFGRGLLKGLWDSNDNK